MGENYPCTLYTFLRIIVVRSQACLKREENGANPFRNNNKNNMKKTATPKKEVSPKKKPKGKKSGAVKVVYNPDLPLTINEEIFCQYYVLNAETRNNAFQSYVKAYSKEEEIENAPKDDAIYEEIEVNGKMTKGGLIKSSSFERVNTWIRREASKVLTKPHIQRRVYELLNTLLKDEIVDAELVKVIVQDEERPSKVRAIEEYNKLRQRSTKSTVEHEFGNINPEISDKELREFIEQGEAFFQKKNLPKKK